MDLDRETHAFRAGIAERLLKEVFSRVQQPTENLFPAAIGRPAPFVRQQLGNAQLGSGVDVGLESGQDGRHVGPAAQGLEVVGISGVQPDQLQSQRGDLLGEPAAQLGRAAVANLRRPKFQGIVAQLDHPPQCRLQRKLAEDHGVADDHSV